jgi:hypothetical protein
MSSSPGMPPMAPRTAAGHEQGSAIGRQPLLHELGELYLQRLAVVAIADWAAVNGIVTLPWCA